MKAILSALVLFAATAAHADLRIQDCREANVGINNLVGPVAKNSKSFYKGQVMAYNIDTVEPAAASAGLAFVIPPTEEEDPTGGLKCISVLNFRSIDINKAIGGYTEGKGLLLAIPAVENIDGTDTKKVTIKLRIDLKKSTITKE